jgi:hypothetical protein
LSIGNVKIVSIAHAHKPLTLALLASMVWVSTLPITTTAVRRRSLLGFYALAAFAMWVFALGPDPQFLGHRALYQAPYGWLMRLPGFDALRVPARFWMMSLVCLSGVSALAVNRLTGRTRRAVVSVAAVGLLLDGWPKQFIVHDEPERRPAPPGVFARLDLPMADDLDILAMYRQIFDSTRLYNGFSGYAAPHVYAMRQLLSARDPRMLDALTQYGSLGIVVNDADQQGHYRDFVMAHPGAVRHETHPQWSSYRLPTNTNSDTAPDQNGEPLAIKRIVSTSSPVGTSAMVDGKLDTRWSGGLQQSAADLTIELVEVARVGQLVTEMGAYWADVPTLLRIDVSPDGATWEAVYSGDTWLQSYHAAVRHPKSVPVVFPIQRDDVRFVRLTQLGRGTHDWSIAELRVLR